MRWDVRGAGGQRTIEEMLGYGQFLAAAPPQLALGSHADAATPLAATSVSASFLGNSLFIGLIPLSRSECVGVEGRSTTS